MHGILFISQQLQTAMVKNMKDMWNRFNIACVLNEVQATKEIIYIIVTIISNKHLTPPGFSCMAYVQETNSWT
jgi:hypothetical protein